MNEEIVVAWGKKKYEWYSFVYLAASAVFWTFEVSLLEIIPFTSGNFCV